MSRLHWSLLPLALSCCLGGMSAAQAGDAPRDARVDGTADEAREAPSLRQPLPTLAPPGEMDEAPTTFSTEAPPPPPLDTGYRPAAPPGPGTSGDP